MKRELTLFRTGAVDIVRSAFTLGLAPDAAAERVVAPVWSALVRTTEGLVLFDTGLHPVHVTRPEATFGPQATLRIVMDEEDAILRRLAALDVAPEDISIVVNSHLHFDHAGNNGAFPRATFLVQADHLAFAKGKPNFPGIYWDIAGLAYLPISGRTRVAQGVEALPTPGHAPGHQSLVVDLPETGRVVLCGDAAFTRENIERGESPAPDQASARESIGLIRSLVAGDLDRAFPSHDGVSWSRWRHAPEVYR